MICLSLSKYGGKLRGAQEASPFCKRGPGGLPPFVGIIWFIIKRESLKHEWLPLRQSIEKSHMKFLVPPLKQFSLPSFNIYFALYFYKLLSNEETSYIIKYYQLFLKTKRDFI